MALENCVPLKSAGVTPVRRHEAAVLMACAVVLVVVVVGAVEGTEMGTVALPGDVTLAPVVSGMAVVLLVVVVVVELVVVVVV